MGTTWSVRFAHRQTDAGRLQHKIQAALDQVVAQMSTWDPDSAISRLNHAETGWYQLAPAFFQVLSCALGIAAASDGAYDPTTGALVNLWGFGAAGAVASPPSMESVHAARAQGGWRRTRLDAQHRAVWQPGGMQFDLSSIAKGYGVDEMARELDEAGVANYLVELGGELKARGVRPDGKAWALDIETPDHATQPVPGQPLSGWSLAEQPSARQAVTGRSLPDQPLPAGHLPITLDNAAIATSGDYRRYFNYQGKRFSHTLDPRTGMPLDNKLASVSVIHPQCMMADGLSTALLCLGPEKGLQHAQQNKIAALFLTRHHEGIAATWTDEFVQLAGANALTPCN